MKLWTFLFLFSIKLVARTNDLGADLLDPFYLLFLLIGITLLPFIAIMLTCFTKIVVVLSIARQAIGTAQTPPNMVIMSLSIILTIFSMYPVFTEISRNLDLKAIDHKKPLPSGLLLIDQVKEPLRQYMIEQTKDSDQKIFLKAIKNTGREDVPQKNDFITLAPAFLLSQLTLAFQIGFLIYLPFLVIDMTIANLLMALGMQMLAPTTISLPFKILLFVLVDGWRLIAQGLIKG